MTRLARLMLFTTLLTHGCTSCDRRAPADAAIEDVGDEVIEDTALEDASDDTRAAGLEITDTFPADGAVLVPITTELAAAFSRPVRADRGAFTLRDESGATWPLDTLVFGASRATVRAMPRAPLPPGRELTLTLAGFEADDGALAAELTIRFTTEDREAPTVLTSQPSEGELVDPALATLEVTFSEPMRVDRGAATLVAPTGSVLLPRGAFTDRTARIALPTLAADRSYEVTFEGFEDLAGNVLDARRFGSDARLDFSTGPDTTPPFVLEATPAEGQLDVEVALLSRVVLVFSEPLDPTRGRLALSVDGGAPIELTPTFSSDGTRVTATVRGLLGATAPHRLIVEGLVDVAGNPLDEGRYLGDGALDFTTGEDSFAPFVAFLSPGEGDRSVPADADRIVVTFSESMEDLPRSVELVGDGRTVRLEGSWSAGHTILTLPAPMLQGGRAYRIDFRAFRDPGGTALDATHPYLGDGIADFSLVAPTGERCGDALTETEATMLPSGAYAWNLTTASTSDGSMICDVDGHSPDAVVRYRKRSATSILHVTALATTTAPIDVEIYRDACRPTADTADAARLRCMPERTRWEQWLRGPEGDYFVWVATEASATFRGATVTVEEIATAPDGESCIAPLGEGSPEYTPPPSEGAFHTWVLPAAFSEAPDRSVSPGDALGALSCLPAGASLGHDSVVRYDKRSDTSLVTVRVTIPATSTFGTAGGIEIARGCDPAATDYAPLACWSYEGRALSYERTFDGPRGPLSVWVAEHRDPPLPGGVWRDLPEVRVEIAELEPGLGDSCATAFELTPGLVNTVSARSIGRVNVPRCLPDGGVTWFRYTPSEGLGLAVTDGASVGAVVDAASGEVLRCGDTTEDVLPAFVEPGREVCLAIHSSEAITTLRLDEVRYDGVLGREIEVPLQRDPAAPTTPILSASGWMAEHAGQLVRGGSSVFSGSTAGGFYTWWVPTGMCRHAGISRSTGLYCVAERTTESEPRIFRVLDGSGARVTPEPIEVLGEVRYPLGRRLGAITWDGSQFLVASAAESVLPSTTTPTSFYAVRDDGEVIFLGVNDAMSDVAGLAADATYVYLAGRMGMMEGIYRLRRDQLDDALQAPVELDSGLDLFADDGTLAADSWDVAHALYFRTSNAPRSDVRVIVEPSSVPAFRGILWRAPGTEQNSAFGYDPVSETIWLLDGNATGGPRWVGLR